MTRKAVKKMVLLGEGHAEFIWTQREDFAEGIRLTSPKGELIHLIKKPKWKTPQKVKLWIERVG